MYGNKQIANCLLGNFILYITSEQNTESVQTTTKKNFENKVATKNSITILFFSLIFYICVDEKSLFSSVTTLNYY